MLSLMNHFLRVSLMRPGYKCRSCSHVARCSLSRLGSRRKRVAFGNLLAPCDRTTRPRHDALQDAWLAMQVYLWLHKSVLWQTPFSVIAEPEPQNPRDFPQDRRAAPRRKAKRKAAGRNLFPPSTGLPGPFGSTGGAGRLTDEQASALTETLEGRKLRGAGIDTVAIRAPRVVEAAREQGRLSHFPFRRKAARSPKRRRIAISGFPG